MNYIMLFIAFIMLAGVAVLFCNLLHLNPAEGMILAVLVIIAADAAEFLLFGKYMMTFLIVGVIAAVGIASSVYGWYNKGKVEFGFILSPYMVSLTAVFLLSLMIYHGDIIQNLEELNLWALADKTMCQEGQLYYHNGGYAYFQGTSLFRYFFLKLGGYSEGALYGVNALLCWIGLLLPFGKIRWNRSPRILLYILLVHVGLYSMYYYGSKSLGPELVLACWTGGLAGWWITRERKKQNIIVLFIGALTACTFTTSFDIALVGFVLLLAALQITRNLFVDEGEDEETDPAKVADHGQDGEGIGSRTDLVCMAALTGAILVLLFLFVLFSGFTYLRENMTTFFRCLVENNMTLWGSDLNYTFIFNAVLFMILMVVAADKAYQRRLAGKYIIYSAVVSFLYIIAMIFGMVDDTVHTAETYTITIQRYIGALVIFLFVMGLSWMLCEKRILKRKISYIPGLVLLVIFLYGVNDSYLTKTTAAYPEKAEHYAELQRMIRECNFIRKKVSSKNKLYLINQGEEIASAEAKYQLGDQVSDFLDEPWMYTVNGGIKADQVDPYDGIETLPASLTKEKYKYVWIHKTDEYLSDTLPTIMGDEVEDKTIQSKIKSLQEQKKNQTAKDKDKSREDSDSQTALKSGVGFVSNKEMSGGQIYQVLYSNKGTAKRLKLAADIVPYDNRAAYYRWNDILVD